MSTWAIRTGRATSSTRCCRKVRFAEAGSPAPARVAVPGSNATHRRRPGSTTVARIPAGRSSPGSTPSRTWCNAPLRACGRTPRMHLRGPHRCRRARAGAGGAFRHRCGTQRTRLAPRCQHLSTAGRQRGMGARGCRAFSRALQRAGAQLPVLHLQSRFALGAGRGARHLGTASARCATHA